MSLPLKPSTNGFKVVGLDPSLRNWGIAQGELHLEGFLPMVRINQLSVVNPVLPTGKQVRQNSLDLESAKQLYQVTWTAVTNADVIFVEVPVGSQSARAMASYGICVGVLGALRASGIPFFEVTPTEVKLAGPGKKTATKDEMIRWATGQHPEANWPYYTQKGQSLISEAKAEHMADAVGAIYAGLHSNAFQQFLPFLRGSSSTQIRTPHADYSQAI